MKDLLRFAALALVALLVALPSFGAANVLHMRCFWKKSTDMRTLMATQISGSTDFFYEPMSDITGTMSKEEFEHPFVAGIRDKLIEGVSHYQADGVMAEQRVEINRYTGAIMNLIKTGMQVQVLEGTCTRISGPDFDLKGSG